MRDGGKCQAVIFRLRENLGKTFFDQPKLPRKIRDYDGFCELAIFWASSIVTLVSESERFENGFGLHSLSLPPVQKSMVTSPGKPQRQFVPRITFAEWRGESPLSSQFWLNIMFTDPMD